MPHILETVWGFQIILDRCSLTGRAITRQAQLGGFYYSDINSFIRFAAAFILHFMFDDKLPALWYGDSTRRCGKDSHRGTPRITCQRGRSCRAHVNKLYGLPDTCLNVLIAILVNVVCRYCGGSDLWGFYQLHTSFSGTGVVGRGHNRDINLSNIRSSPFHHRSSVLVGETVCGRAHYVPSK